MKESIIEDAYTGLVTKGFMVYGRKEIESCNVPNRCKAIVVDCYLDGCNGCCASMGGDTYIFIFANKMKKEDMLPIIVHEVEHAVQYICRYMEIEKGDEFKAYTAQNIFKRMAKDFGLI